VGVREGGPEGWGDVRDSWSGGGVGVGWERLGQRM